MFQYGKIRQNHWCEAAPFLAGYIIKLKGPWVLTISDDQQKTRGQPQSQTMDYQTISDYIRLSIFHVYSNGSSFRKCLNTMASITIFWDPFPMLKSQARRDLRPGVAALCGHRRGRLRCTPFGSGWDPWDGETSGFLGENMGILVWEFRSDSPKKWGFQFWFNDFGWIWDLRSSPKTSGLKFWFPQEWWVWIDFTWCICLWKMTTFWWRFNGDKVTVVCLVSWIFLRIITTHELEKIYLTK